MKKLFLLCLVFTIVLVSCDDQEFPVVDAENGQSLISFGVTSTSLQVIVDRDGTIDVPVNITTMSPQDRTFNVNMVADLTTAIPGSFSFGSITIPANTFNGVLTIDGVDNGVEIAPEQLVLEIDPGADAITEGQLTVDIFQVCPVDETFFTGDYEITVDAPGVFGAGTFGATGTVVTLAADGFNRTFTADYFEDDRFPREFTIVLTCNTVVVPRFDAEVGCGGNDVNLVIGPPSGMNGVYDSFDDSSFTINLTDNVDSDCGGGPVQASYTFTRL